jgi:hypothetical protein
VELLRAPTGSFAVIRRAYRRELIYKDKQRAGGDPHRAQRTSAQYDVVGGGGRARPFGPSSGASQNEEVENKKASTNTC